MSRIHLTIDRIVLRGVETAAQKPFIEGLQSELSRVLADLTKGTRLAPYRRTPVLKMGGIQLESGPSGGRRFGTQVARTIGKGLKP
jgi:hypothetical protein